MQRKDEIGSVRFEKMTVVRMVRVEAYDSSNVNDPRDRREVHTLLATKTKEVHPNDLPMVIEAVNNG